MMAVSLRIFAQQSSLKEVSGAAQGEDHQQPSPMHRTVLPSSAQQRVLPCPLHRHALQVHKPRPEAPHIGSRSRRAMLTSMITIVAAATASNTNAHAADDPATPTSASSITTVFVAGATGQTGSRVVTELRKRGYKVIAGVRSPGKAASLGFDKDPGITVVRADVTEGVEPLAAAIGDAQAVVCALGYNGGSDPQGFIEVDSKGTIALIQAAQQRSVRTFVLESSVLTGADKLGPLARLGYAALNFGTNALDRKQEAEAALKAAVEENTGMLKSYTIVRPAALSNEPEDAVGVPFFKPADTILGAQSVSRDSVAALMVAALEQPGAVNTTVEVASKKGGTPVPESEWFAFAGVGSAVTSAAR